MIRYMGVALVSFAFFCAVGMFLPHEALSDVVLTAALLGLIISALAAALSLLSRKPRSLGSNTKE